MKNNLIGISGKIGSGKDATGIILDMISEGFSVKSIVSFVEKGQFNGYTYQIKKYADKLKGGCEYVFPSEFSVKEWETGDRSYRDEIMPSLGISRRDFLLKKGDNCRAIHSDYFVNALFADYKAVKVSEKVTDNLNLKSYKKPNWIITDVRFPNEAQAIKDRGGIVIRVNRLDVDKFTTNFPQTLHPSETALDDYEFDHVIDNNGSIEELIKKVKQLEIL